MTKICKKCGSENPDSSTFCKDCGKKLGEDKRDNKNIILIGALVIIIAILLVTAIYMGGFLGHQEVPLEDHDFGGISMLVPKGSNYVETRSLPSYGSVVGGFVMLENAGNYSREAFSIMFSTSSAKSHPPEVSLDRQEGDITIYKDSEGRDGLYMVRQVDDVEVTLIGNDEETMIKMLNSVKLTDDFTQNGQTTTQQTSSSSSSSTTESGDWVSIGSYSGSGSGSETVNVPEGKIMVKLSAYPIKNYDTNHLYVSGSNGESGGVDWGSKSAVETRSDSFTYTSTSSETFTIDYYETVSWEVEFFKYQ